MEKKGTRRDPLGNQSLNVSERKLLAPVPLTVLDIHPTPQRARSEVQLRENCVQPQTQRKKTSKKKKTTNLDGKSSVPKNGLVVSKDLVSELWREAGLLELAWGPD